MKFDIIIHTATYGQPGKFINDQIRTLKLNTETVFRLINLLEPNGKFLYLSSSEVYSGNYVAIESECGFTTPYHPRACYIEGKRCGETIVNSAGIDGKSIRLQLAYGMGTKKYDERVLNQFILMGLKDKKITLKDMGDAKRTYIYINDVIELLWKILFLGKEKVYNVGGEDVITIKELAESVGEILNVEVFLPRKINRIIGSPQNTIISIEKIKKEFGIELTSLKKGLKKTIEWQRKLYEIQ